MLKVKSFFHQQTGTFCHVANHKLSLDAIVIDPVLDYHEADASLSQNFLDSLLDYIRAQNLRVKLILDTHCHADHVSGAYALKRILNVKSATGRAFLQVQNHFLKFYDMAVSPDGDEPYEILLAHSQTINVGSINIKALDVSGHTPSCMAYLIDDALFCGDALLMPERGCGRCDFPGASAANLYDNVTQNIYTLPDATRIFVGHDYPAQGTNPKCETTVAESREENIILSSRITKEEFILRREQRDKTLPKPRLLFAAMRMNILGGRLPSDS